MPTPTAGTPPDRGGDGQGPPLALAEVSRHGLRVAATDPAAERAGVSAGMPLADARALCPALAVASADPEGDTDALGRLALWCGRYSPWIAADAPDGVALDITGCAHLFGGEETMLDDIVGRLAGFGLTARVAAAPTLGAAWAVARHGPASHGQAPWAVVTDGTLADVLAPLPLAALRLDETTVEAMARVGLKRVRDVLGKPAAPLTARFGPRLLTRLDQALGRQAETVHGLQPPPRHQARRVFAEPIVLTADVERTVAELAGELAIRLDDAGVGARRLDLRLYRVDGHVRTAEVRTGTLCREAPHMIRLFRERLTASGEELDTGFGFDLAVLAAQAVEPVVARQDGLGVGTAASREHPDEVARLLDRFGNRFGFDRVVRYAPRASTIPERAVRTVPVLEAARPGEAVEDWPAHLRAVQGGTHLGRPLLLVLPPDPIATVAEVPDGPPVQFEWRRVTHRVVRADGPERLAPEWWRPGDGRHTRDYFRVEDSVGRRFWLFREGLYDRPGDTPRWFLHGLFA
ncbi:DNA repair protein [Thalassobaculum fulvum]|uniref:DNA-directed DNA polymerase n=1 Tax=Thalassobaculum fulvum TaxID=1633335 RepID=A0A918XQE4_9PROT|nr:DNA polymerase Y family protein [Thalassobaculum fulvum]GHD44554.1 DNA repair protein [Thalassobaculum fulvum]